jgi:hypothetical protein
MTKRRFGKRSRFAVIIMAAALAAPSAWAQQAEPAPKPGKPINAGDVLSGELNAMKGSKKTKRAATYQITSEPRRLPAPSGLCNLETGPVPACHQQRGSGRAAEKFHRQGNFRQGRRSRLRAGCRANERSCRHQMERGDQALSFRRRCHKHRRHRDPVRRGLSVLSQLLWNTGSPPEPVIGRAFARSVGGDDDEA